MAEDDIENLLKSLDTPSAGAPPPSSQARMSTTGTDALDALMAELGGPAPARSTPPPAAPSPKPPSGPPPSAPPPSAPPPKPPAASSGVDELDDLMNQLSTPTKSTPAPAPAATRSVAPPPKPAAKPAPTPGFQNAQDDLDALMNQLHTEAKSPASAPTPPRNNVAPPPAAAPPASTSGPRAPAPAGKGVMSGMSKKELDTMDINAMMNDIRSQMGEPAPGEQRIQKGVCAVCRQTMVGEMMSVGGKTYHVKCFSCAKCKREIGTKPYFEVNGQNICESCNPASGRCAGCNQPVTGKVLVALDKKWHPEHFSCQRCQKPFPNGQFFEANGLPYCETDYYLTIAPKCSACGKEVLGDCINALGQQWHPEHFTCAYCRKPFPNDVYHELAGKPYCEAHYQQMSGASCLGCGKGISGKFVGALGGKYHPEHFLCAFCQNPLNPTSYKEAAGKAYCPGCFAKLFA